LKVLCKKPLKLLYKTSALFLQKIFSFFWGVLYPRTPSTCRSLLKTTLLINLTQILTFSIFGSINQHKNLFNINLCNHLTCTPCATYSSHPLICHTPLLITPLFVTPYYLSHPLFVTPLTCHTLYLSYSISFKFLYIQDFNYLLYFYF